MNVNLQSKGLQGYKKYFTLVLKIEMSELFNQNSTTNRELNWVEIDGFSQRTMDYTVKPVMLTTFIQSDYNNFFLYKS